MAARGARAAAAMPVIGLLISTSFDGFAELLRAFRRGLKETGYVEGENVSFELRSADNQLDRLPELVSQLVRRQVAVIGAAGGITAALVAKAATTTIPVVFVVGDDPVRYGLVASLARPGSNLTGINFFTVELAAKRLEVLRELVPWATRIAVLVNPANAVNTEATVRDVETAARTMDLKIQILNAATSQEIDAAFASLARKRPDALFVGTGPPFTGRRVQLALLAASHKLPAIYGDPRYVEAGGLMSYGASLVEAYRQAGVYTGRILKGAKPADLPVLQSTKFELVINAQTARVIGLDVPPTLLARADEVIE